MFRRAPRAFTLVELLVVVGIIAVLIGVLLPSLATARRSAQITQCLSIERQIGIGAFSHAQSHRGYYPLAGHFKGLPSVGGANPAALNDSARLKYTYMTVDEPAVKGLTVTLWHAAVALQFGKKRATDGRNVEEIRILGVGDDSYLKYFLCPSHKDVAADAAYQFIYHGGGYTGYVQQSYVVNEAVFGIDDTRGRLRGQSSKVRRPAETVMLADGLYGNLRDFSLMGNGVNWVTFINKTAARPVSLADALEGNAKAGDSTNFDKARHRNKVNILFMDGHAETRTIDPRDLQNAYLLPS